MAIGFGGHRIIATRDQQPQYQTAQSERRTLISSVSASGTVGPDFESAQEQAAALAAYLSAKNTLESEKAKMNSLQATLFEKNQTFVNGAGTESPDTDDPTYIIQRGEWLKAEADYKNQANVIAHAQAALNSAWIAYNKLFPTTQPNGTHAIVNLTEIDVVEVRPGQKVTLTLDAFPDKTFTGKVSTVNTNGLVSSGVIIYPSTITFDIATDNIYPLNVILVPSAAVQTTDGQSQVRVMRNGQVTQVPVETGDSNDTQTEIVSGISEGETVITGITTPGGPGRDKELLHLSADLVAAEAVA